MERDSLGYKVRRKMQMIASHVLPHELLCRVYSKIVINKNVRIHAPETFNEKIQWCKLYYFPNNPLIVQCADKLAVRGYIEEKGFKTLLVPLLGMWDNDRQIDWKTLPNQFVLKCNHGCAYNILCHDKKNLNQHDIAKQLRQWMKEDFGAFNLELHYSKIKKHMIICEEYLGECITDYKFFCFNGKPECLYVSSDLINDRQAKIGFFYLDGQKMPMTRDDYEDIKEIVFPPFFDEMKRAAEILCKDFPFVRVDFFVMEDRFYFAELTFTPGAGMMPFNPDTYDKKWGDMLNLGNIIQTYGHKHKYCL